MNRREFLFSIASLILYKPSLASAEIKARDEESLEKYLKSIENEYFINKKVVEKNDVMAGFKEMNRSKRIEDFSTYFPMYKAGQIKYQVPWFLLWLVHEQETMASTALDPEISVYKGGMQRSPFFYDDTYVKKAVEGWEMLAKLPQRYRQDQGSVTNDYEEILFAARKTAEDSQKLRLINPNLGWENSYFEAQFLYCNQYSAKKRVDQFKKINPLFNKALRDFKWMEYMSKRKNIE